VLCAVLGSLPTCDKNLPTTFFEQFSLAASHTVDSSCFTHLIFQTSFAIKMASPALIQPHVRKIETDRLILTTTQMSDLDGVMPLIQDMEVMKWT